MVFFNQNRCVPFNNLIVNVQFTKKSWQQTRHKGFLTLFLMKDWQFFISVCTFYQYALLPLDAGNSMSNG